MSHDTYFVIAHFHYIMVDGMTASWAGCTTVAKNHRANVPGEVRELAALVMFIGFNLTFFPPVRIWAIWECRRRYHAYPARNFRFYTCSPPPGTTILSIAYLLPITLPGLVALHGRKAEANPGTRNGFSNGKPLAATQT